MRIRMPDGTPLTVRVAAVYALGGGFADVLLPRATLLSHTGHQLDQMVLVRARPGVGTARLDRALRQLSGPYPGLAVVDKQAFLAGQRKTQDDQGRAAGYLILGLALIFAGASTVNTLMVSTGERAREFAVLRLVGATRGQLLRMIGWETLVIIVFGLLCSSLIAGLTVVAITFSYVREVVVSVPADVYVISGAAALLAVLASLVPAQLALRTNPIAAIAAL
jgi:putative ABC transport system permease protein